MTEKAITNSEAGVAAKALIDHFFHNDAPKPNIRIPATEEDTDLILTRYIKQQAARDAAIGELARAAERKVAIEFKWAVRKGSWTTEDEEESTRSTEDLAKALENFKAVQHG